MTKEGIFAPAEVAEAPQDVDAGRDHDDHVRRQVEVLARLHDVVRAIHDRDSAGK